MMQLDAAWPDIADLPLSLMILLLLLLSFNMYCFLQFNSVTTLSILVESNQGDEDTTKVFKIALGGTAFDSFNVAEIKKVEEKS